ncbi:MAG: hypothetical protein M1833_001395 [Piccolia ochrophora]|nr:MAG: hypothetical protein M1833_001395 [Piccolia ochrophora]
MTESDVWRGSIICRSSPALDDVNFSATTPLDTSESLPYNTSLEFLSLVRPSCIPKHLAIGPALSVWTTTPATEGWFADALLRQSATKIHAAGDDEERPIQVSGSLDSDIGVLLRVVNADEFCQKTVPTVTEVLIYGSWERQASNKGPLATPPNSSSPGPQPTVEEDETRADEHHSPQVLKVYARLLCSDLLYKSSEIPRPRPLTTTDHTTFKKEINHTPEHESFSKLPVATLASPSPSLKRRRACSLFEDAAHHRKRVRKDGGQRVSAAMAADAIVTNPIQQPAKFIGAADGASTRPKTADPHGKPAHLRRSLSRASSISSFSYNLGGADSRPLSRRGGPNGTRVSSPSRSTSFTQALTANCSLKIDNAKLFDVRNKDALSKVVMAGMRIYGLQQLKRTGRPQSATEESFVMADRIEEVDEYKMVYHQTFKAACCALRKYLTISIIKQDTLREVVDKLLAIFCTDPVQLENDPPSGEFGEGRLDEDNPFVPHRAHLDGGITHVSQLEGRRPLQQVRNLESSVSTARRKDIEPG